MNLLDITSAPQPKRRRVAWALLAGAVVGAAVLVGAPLLLAHHHYDSAIEDASARLDRFERLSAARPALERKLEAVRAAGGSRFFLKATTASLASAELQEKVRGVVEANGGRVVSVQVAQPREDQRFRQVGVTVQLNATAGALRKLLVALEAAEPSLLVDALTVRSQVPPGFKAAPGFDPEMFVQLDVSAFSLGS